MTLGVDRTLDKINWPEPYSSSKSDWSFPHSLSSMEVKQCSRRWKTQIPEFIHTRGLPQATKDTERGSIEKERERGGPRKSVTMAPTSRYLTDRQYVVRRPLFSVEQQTSILKKTYPLEHPEKEKQRTSFRREQYQQHADMDYLTRPREELTSDSLSLSQGNSSSPSNDNLGSSLGTSDLMGRLSHDEPTFGSPYQGSVVPRHSLSRPSLEVHTLTSSPRPRLTSTLLSPTYTPRSRYSRPQQTEFRLGGKGGTAEVESNLNICSSIGYLKRRISPALHTMSPNQANYWACAIPKSLPPSPDRSSPSWDPDREYQALLDYTYPLKPGRVVSEWDGSELQVESKFQTEPGLQDSGIELDHLCSSTSLSGLDFSLRGTGQNREKATLSAGHRSSDLHRHPKSSDDLPLDSPISLTDPIGLSLESLDSNNDRSGMNDCTHNKVGGQYRQHGALPSSSSTAFIRSTRVLPQPGCVSSGQWDEEFRPLPDQLEELQLLSRQVREVTAQLSQPVTASWESLEPGTTSIPSSITLPEKQDAEEVEEQVKEQEGDGQETDEGKEVTEREEGCVPETSRYLTKVHHVDSSEAERKSPGVWMESVSGGLSQSSLREVEALIEQLSGLTLSDMQKRSQEDQERTESLMQYIQMFCSNLEQLIQWLYTVSNKIEVLAPPTVDIDSVKSSLAEYQSFQREVSSHQPLTISVLQTGELLLNCINSTSPVLRDTLVLIERQSRALETHTEHLFSSILSAMDSLTQPANQVK